MSDQPPPQEPKKRGQHKEGCQCSFCLNKAKKNMTPETQAAPGESGAPSKTSSAPSSKPKGMAAKIETLKTNATATIKSATEEPAAAQTPAAEKSWWDKFCDEIADCVGF